MRLPLKVPPLLPQVMTLVLGIASIACYYILKSLDWGDNLIAIIILLFLVAFTNISFAANIGPYFYRFMGYTVTDQNKITASDATNSILSSVLAVVIGYVILKYGSLP